MPEMTPPLKMVFCWSDISGYMAACWQALHHQPDIDGFVLAFQAQTETAFADQLMADIPCRLLDKADRQNADLIKQVVLDRQPDIVVLCGWFHPPYRALPFAPELRQIPFIMGMDTPWQASLKQWLAPMLLSPYLNRLARVVVTGERSWQYARRLGIEPARLRRGCTGSITGVGRLYMTSAGPTGRTRFSLPAAMPRKKELTYWLKPTAATGAR